MSTTSAANATISRRKFLILPAAALVASYQAAAEQSAAANGSVAGHAERVINAGPMSRYAADGVYGGFSNQGFFVVRAGDRLAALSSYCTHRKCQLTANPDRSFACPCHGSAFDPNGKVTEGPAKRDLPVFASFTNETGELLVQIPNRVELKP